MTNNKMRIIYYYAEIIYKKTVINRIIFMSVLSCFATET